MKKNNLCMLFLCLGNEFTEEMKYKENYFIQAAVELGHKTTVIACTKKYNKGKPVETEECDINYLGYRLVRIKNKKIINSFITDKIRVTPNLLNIIYEIKPDVIFFNCPQIWNVNELDKIKGYFPHCRIVWDFSTWYGNSAKSWVSLNILHKIIYKNWLQHNQKYVDAIYYISYDVKKFISEVYALDRNKMELNDLPSNTFSYDDLKLYRKRFRENRKIKANTIVFVHTGKFNSRKRTLEVIKSFIQINSKYDSMLYLVGDFEDDIKNEAIKLINSNSSIEFTGFLDGDRMLEILTGCDIYLQPGTTSQTFQEALCRGCVPIYAERSYDEELVGEFGWLIKQENELMRLMELACINADRVEIMRKELITRINNKLNYKRLYMKMIGL